jgi:hypothetical protein
MAKPCKVDSPTEGVPGQLIIKDEDVGINTTRHPIAHCGIVAAEHVVVDGKVEGPIQGGAVFLKSQAHVACPYQFVKVAPSLAI